VPSAGTACCVKCAGCAWYTCLRCEKSFSTGDVVGVETVIEHECDPSRDWEVEEPAFRGLKRGREWQLCPNEGCKRRVELSDGCNHVRCFCRMHFCFLCGLPVRDGEGHWRKDGGCPRFGQKDSKRAIYDEHDEWNDNDDVDDEERARRMQREDDGEGEALRRAFDLQMQMVEDMMREIEDAEAARILDRALQNEGMADGFSSEQPNYERRRRRPREDRGMNDERRRERHDARRRAEAQQFYAQQRVLRRKQGLRAFVNNTINALGRLLLGRPPPRRR